MDQHVHMNRIGLIAGGGQFPIIFSKAARAQGLSVYAAAFQTETAPELADHVDEIQWVYLGQFKRILKFFKANGVTDSVMMGTIKKTRLFSDVRPDIKAISIMAGMKNMLINLQKIM